MDSISPIPDSSLEDPYAFNILLAPGRQELAQAITDLLKSQLDCNYVSLIKLDIAEDRLKIIAMSGLSPQQRRRIAKATQKYALSSFVEPLIVRQLLLKKLTIIPRAQLSLPAELQIEEDPQNILFVPLFVSPQNIGCLIIGKTENEKIYSPEEIEQVKSIAALINLIIRQFRLRTRIVRAEASQKALQETNQRINEFLNQASHELRTPLTVLMGHLQLAQRRLQNSQNVCDDEKREQRMESTRQTLNEAMQGAIVHERIINDMLDDSLIQTNTLTTHLQCVDLCQIVQTTITDLQSLTPDHEIVLIMKNENRAVMIMADQPRLKRVINTFIRHALTYSPVGKPVTVQINVEEGIATVAVQDQGPGLSPEDQASLWQRFYRPCGINIQFELDLSLGLGMYLCRAFIELHHGKVGVESVQDQGTTLWFKLPAQVE